MLKRILILGDVNSAHLRKWVTVLSEKKAEMGIYSLSMPASEWYKPLGAELLSSSGFGSETFGGGLTGKLGYFRKAKELRQVIQSFRPDVIHAHYASSYGMLGRMAGFHPFFISVWGSDVILFPSNPVNRYLLKKNLKAADRMIASSRYLASCTGKYTAKDVAVIPFGVDTSLFTYHERETGRVPLVIGTVKSLEPVYGIDLLIRAFAGMLERLPETKAELHIVGDGPLRQELEQMAVQLGCMDSVRFIGPMSQQELVSYYHRFDIAAFLSRSESFGVAALEAASTGLPLVVSRVGGLPEITVPGETALCVDPENVTQATDALLKLAADHSLRTTMGRAGRTRVENLYELQKSKQDIFDLYGL